MNYLTPKQRRQLDAATVAGVRDRLNMIPRHKTVYRHSDDQAMLRRAYERGWDWAAANPCAAGWLINGPSEEQKEESNDTV